MRGVNRVTILGRVGQDPEIRYTAGGDAICNFSLATSEQWKDKHTGEKKEKTEWHKCTAFKRLAEICGEYMQKGAAVYVEGRLQTDKYQKDGQDHYSTKIIIETVQLLDGGKDKKEGSGDPRYNPNGTQKSYSNAPPGQSHHAPPPPSDHMFDDDIPF